MALKAILGDVVLPSAARGSGTHASGPIANSGATSNVVVLVHCTAVSGTSPTLNVVLQSSNDGSSWSSVASSATTQLTAAGNAMSNALVDDDYIQVLATVGGTDTPTATCRVAVLVIPS
ncbi:MAG: hypothetical protein ACRDTZ_00980 [Pseudonocardiaceae bacterium]